MSEKPKTLNEGLDMLRSRGHKPTKIESGWYVADLKRYLLCKCDGNSDVMSVRCVCRELFDVCNTCLEDGRITHCINCTNRFKQIDRTKRRIDTPIDFDELIAQGVLARLSETEFRLLVPLAQLPKFVDDQIVDISGDDNGPILTFA